MIRRSKGFTLVEIMIVVAIIGILIAIAVPSFLRAREISRRNACQENLTKIDGAVQQWTLEENVSGDTEPGWDDLVASDGTLYLRKTPECPGGGDYTLASANGTPECSLNTGDFAHILPQADDGGGGGGTP